MECLNVVVGIRALAADVEGESFDDEPVVTAALDQVDGLAGRRPELARELYHRACIRDLEPQAETSPRSMLRNLFHFLDVVVGHQRAILIELVEGLDRLDRVGVDDLVPDEVLPFLGGELPDELVDGVKLLHARHVEAAAEFVEGLDDRRIAIHLDCVVGLHPGEVPLEKGVVFPQFGMVHDEQGRAMLLGEVEQRLLVHIQSPSVKRKFLNCHGSVRSIMGRLNPWKALE